MNTWHLLLPLTEARGIQRDVTALLNDGKRKYTTEAEVRARLQKGKGPDILTSSPQKDKTTTFAQLCSEGSDIFGRCLFSLVTLTL